jgi:hypothetical protein
MVKRITVIIGSSKITVLHPKACMPHLAIKGQTFRSGFLPVYYIHPRQLPWNLCLVNTIQAMPLLELSVLASPHFIPDPRFLTCEAKQCVKVPSTRIQNMLSQQNVNHLVVFTDWDFYIQLFPTLMCLFLQINQE